MKISIALAIWLAAGGYAWADETASPQTAPASAAAAAGGQASNAPAETQAPAAPATNPAAPSGWANGVDINSINSSPQAAGAPGTQGPSTGAGTPKSAQSVQSGNDPLPPPSSEMFQKAQDSMPPLTPDELRILKKQAQDVEKAVIAPTVTIVPRISAQTVNLAPGASLPLVRTAVSYPSSLTFIDSTGAPWKIGAAPISGNPAIKAYYVPNSPLMTLLATKPYVSGNVTVYLEGLAVPIVLNVTSGETDSQASTWTVDSRLDMRIPRRGPAAPPGAAPEVRIGLHDQVLQGFLDGVPPKEARQLKTTGNVPDTTVWQMGDDLYIRTRADIRDEFEATLSSADGTHLWKLPVTPYVSFSVMGQTAALNVALE